MDQGKGKVRETDLSTTCCSRIAATEIAASRARIMKTVPHLQTAFMIPVLSRKGTYHLYNNKRDQRLDRDRQHYAVPPTWWSLLIKL